MLELLLRSYLVYLSFVQPVIYGAQLCRSRHSDALQVTNVTLTLIFAWLLEVVDVLFLSPLMAMYWLYLCARIVLALYFAHPRFVGAVQVYQRLFAGLVDTYSPVIDAVVVRHVQIIGDWGLIQYGTHVCTALLRGIAAVAGIARTLMEASTTTTVPAASLPRSMSQERERGEVETVLSSTPLRPPSLFCNESDEEQLPAQRVVDCRMEKKPALKTDAWRDTEDEKAALYPALVSGQPEAVVKHARRRTDPFESFYD
ncbi:hypothetical protein JKF63_00932 [Porcisia hertigi]|uniref:Uncharacterized protein n=1 Tax=Porcisia hertigi TaxID=2761500 RepID=A0A836I951_9TRYP|nr:hypothetical protein JKF63_00932 [Porcisia hertigi]